MTSHICTLCGKLQGDKEETLEHVEEYHRIRERDSYYYVKEE